MKNLFLVLVFAFTSATVSAAPLSPAEADAICHKKALAAAHYLAESRRRFIVEYKIADAVEISTPIRYEYRYPGLDEALYTVIAYAYPDDKSCSIGSVTNNLAGND